MIRVRTYVAATLVSSALFATGCNSHAHATPATPPSVQAAAVSLSTTRDTTRAAELAQGKQLVTTVCVACHTEQPPPKLAPPLAHVSQRYRMQHGGDREKALARIVAWIKAPAKEKSLMPPMAIERFGLMAPLPLPDSQLHAAAAYVWSLSEGDSAMAGMGMEGGMGGMRGMGNMRGMQHGRMTDTTKMKDTTDTKRPQSR